MSEEIKAEELVEYQGKRMYPEVAAYFRVGEAAEIAQEEADSEASHTYNKAVFAARRRWHEADPTSPIRLRLPEHWDSYVARRVDEELKAAHDVYSRAITVANEAHIDARRAAREGLKNSPHPYVRWIEANALSSEQNYSEIILRALPVESPEKLWDLKREHNMCREFDRLYAAAEADGVFDDGKPAPGARELTALRNKIHRDWGSGYATQLAVAMGPYIKAVKAEMEERLAEAKAEWQKLDEARAENATFNRSAGQRARQERERAEREAKAVVVDDEPSTEPQPLLRVRAAEAAEIGV